MIISRINKKNRTILDELADVETGVGHGDLILLVRIQPDLVDTALLDGSGDALLELHVLHHICCFGFTLYFLTKLLSAETTSLDTFFLSNDIERERGNNSTLTKKNDEDRPQQEEYLRITTFINHLFSNMQEQQLL